MLTLLVFFFTLSVLILAHELGHFWAAKRAGIRVEEFGFGFPPKLWSKKIGETVYSLNALPIGGFVRLYGENLDEKVKEKERSFWAQSKISRTGVIAGGVAANFLLAVVIFAVTYSILGIPTKTGEVKIVGVVPDSPAAQAGFLEDDLVRAVDGQKMEDLAAFSALVAERGGREILISFSRAGREEILPVTPRADPPEGEGPLGVIVSDVKIIHYPWWQRPYRGMIEGFKEAFGWAGLILGGLKTMVVDLIIRGEIPKDVAGPVGILQISGSVARGGILAVLQFVGILSVNLAVVNFLPFPALDGGRFLFIVYEAVARRQPSPDFDRKVNTVGVILLLSLAALITVNDLVRVWQTTDWFSRLGEMLPF